MEVMTHDIDGDEELLAQYRLKRGHTLLCRVHRDMLKRKGATVVVVKRRKRPLPRGSLTGHVSKDNRESRRRERVETIRRRAKIMAESGKEP